MIPDALFRLITAAAIAFLPVLITVVRLRRRAVARGEGQPAEKNAEKADAGKPGRRREGPGMVRRWLERQGIHLLGDPEVVAPATATTRPGPGVRRSPQPHPQESRGAGYPHKQPGPPSPTPSAPPRSLPRSLPRTARLGQLTELQRALVWSEVLGPPRGLRPDPFSPARPDGE